MTRLVQERTAVLKAIHAHGIEVETYLNGEKIWLHYAYYLTNASCIFAISAFKFLPWGK